MTEPLDDFVHMRYMVADVSTAVDFYTRHLGFRSHAAMPPVFADVRWGRLRLLLSGPSSSAGGRHLNHA